MQSSSACRAATVAARGAVTPTATTAERTIAAITHHRIGRRLTEIRVSRPHPLGTSIASASQQMAATSDETGRALRGEIAGAISNIEAARLAVRVVSDRVQLVLGAGGDVGVADRIAADANAMMEQGRARSACSHRTPAPRPSRSRRPPSRPRPRTEEIAASAASLKRHREE